MLNLITLMVLLSSIFSTKTLFADDSQSLNKSMCEKGKLQSCFDLGVNLKNSGKLDEARKVYNKACDEGETKSCYNLGILEFEEGNKVKAIHFMKKSCDKGVPNGCRDLGYSEEKKGNKPEARRLYKSACKDGYLRGCIDLGRMEEELGNKAEALRLLKKACDGGNTDGCANLSLFDANIYDPYCTEDILLNCFENDREKCRNKAKICSAQLCSKFELKCVTEIMKCLNTGIGKKCDEQIQTMISAWKEYSSEIAKSNDQGICPKMSRNQIDKLYASKKSVLLVPNLDGSGQNGFVLAPSVMKQIIGNNTLYKQDVILGIDNYSLTTVDMNCAYYSMDSLSNGTWRKLIVRRNNGKQETLINKP